MRARGKKNWTPPNGLRKCSKVARLWRFGLYIGLEISADTNIFGAQQSQLSAACFILRETDIETGQNALGTCRCATPAGKGACGHSAVDEREFHAAPTGCRKKVR